MNTQLFEHKWEKTIDPPASIVLLAKAAGLPTPEPFPFQAKFTVEADGSVVVSSDRLSLVQTGDIPKTEGFWDWPIIVVTQEQMETALFEAGFHLVSIEVTETSNYDLVNALPAIALTPPDVEHHSGSLELNGEGNA